MAWFGVTISNDFEGQIADLENEISNRELKSTEAKIFYDHLTSVHRKLCAFETDIKTLQYGKNRQMSNCLKTIRVVHLRAINLKTKLTEIISATESTPSNEIKDQDEQFKPTKKSEKPKSKALASTSWTEFKDSLASSLSHSSSESDESDSESDSDFESDSDSESDAETSDSESEETKSLELKSTIQSIESKLSNVESLCENILESLSDDDEDWSDSSSDYFDKNRELYENITKKIDSLEKTQNNNFLYQGIILLLFFILIHIVVYESQNDSF